MMITLIKNLYLKLIDYKEALREFHDESED